VWLSILVAAGTGVACRGGAPAGDGVTVPASGVAPPEAVLTSFRYRLSAEASNLIGAPVSPGGPATPIVLAIDGEVASPGHERAATHLSLGVGSLDSESVQIGERVWSRDGVGSWIEGRASEDAVAARTFGLGLDPAVLAGADARMRLRSALAGLTSEPERVAAVDTLRFTLNPERVRKLLGATDGGSAWVLAGASEEWQLWVTRDLWLPARLLLDTQTEQGGRIRVDLVLSDLNVRGIVIEPPK
jgi:hypothetical protein